MRIFTHTGSDIVWYWWACLAQASSVRRGFTRIVLNLHGAVAVENHDRRAVIPVRVFHEVRGRILHDLNRRLARERVNVLGAIRGSIGGFCNQTPRNQVRTLKWRIL